jgi:hypothetical protein
MKSIYCSYVSKCLMKIEAHAFSPLLPTRTQRVVNFLAIYW